MMAYDLLTERDNGSASIFNVLVAGTTAAERIREHAARAEMGHMGSKAKPGVWIPKAPTLGPLAGVARGHSDISPNKKISKVVK